MFDPDYYLCDTASGVVYRKEQFSVSDGQLPLEIIVRDRRYGVQELTTACEAAGLETLAVRPVKAGQWQIALNELDRSAKEILYIGRVR